MLGIRRYAPPMALRPGVLLCDAVGVEQARADCAAADATVFELITTGTNDRDAFFDAVRSTFPLDPPLQSSRSWDALADSLWEGLSNLDDRAIAVFWSGAGDFAAAAPVDYEIAVSVFENITRTLADPDATVGRPRQVSVFIC